MKQKDNWIPKNGEKVWVKVFSNWSAGRYIGFDNDKGIHLVRKLESGGGVLMAALEMLPIESSPNNKNIKQKTAIQDVIDKLKIIHIKRNYDSISIPKMLEKLESAKKTEREQIEEAGNTCSNMLIANEIQIMGDQSKSVGENYYQQKYGDEKQNQ